MFRKRTLFVLVLFTLAAALLLGACQPAAPAAEEPAATEEQAAAVENTAAPAEPTVPAGPQKGGTAVFVGYTDWTTLDINSESGWGVMEGNLYSTLIAVDPTTKEYVPYMAESWTVSEDGLVYTFKLRQDLKFDNGDPLNANDFVYTIQRVMDPATTPGASLQMWGPVASYKALDDYTLELTLAQANSAFLFGMTMNPATAVSQRAIEEAGDNYAFNPVGNGPFKFESYTQGQKLTLVPNPYYTWAPAFVPAGGPYLDKIEIRIIPEYATQIAGLEAGEVTGMVQLDYSDLDRIRSDGRFDFLELQTQGMSPFIAFNVAKPPFDNVLVRRAFSMALNRDSLITLVLQGNATPLYQPLTSATIGYNPSLEEQGIHYDLEGAKALMQEAGYTYDANGMLVTPDGQPFALDLPFPSFSIFPDLGQVLVNQYAALGVTLNLTLNDWPTLWPELAAGNYTISGSGMGYGDAEILPISLLSTNIGTLNISQVNDPVLDEVLNRIRSTTDPAARQAVIDEASLYIMDQAYVVPMYTQNNYYAVNKIFQGYIWSVAHMDMWLNNAHFTE